jgi:hypothetical protein
MFPEAAAHDSGTLALNHDGTRVITSYAGPPVHARRGDRHDARRARHVVDPGSVHGYPPDWSPDDKSIALTLSSHGRLGLVGGLGRDRRPADQPGRDRAARSSAVETLVDTSSDGVQLLPDLLARRTLDRVRDGAAGAGQTSYKQANARLRLVNRDTTRSSSCTTRRSRWGASRRGPSSRRFTQAGGLMFLHVQLEDRLRLLRDRRLLRPDVAHAHRRAQAPGGDASAPPVWLPFQDAATYNYLGAWSERVGAAGRGRPRPSGAARPVLRRRRLRDGGP